MYMTEQSENPNISPLKSFYDRLSDDERRILLEAEGYQNSSTGEDVSIEERQSESIAVATRRITDMTPDEVIALKGRCTFLKITIPGDVIVFNYVHDYAIDLTKMKPVAYGTSNDAIIERWSLLEWNRAKDYALSDALDSLGDINRNDVKAEFVHIENGQQVS